jgi:hypothetical protein
MMEQLLLRIRNSTPEELDSIIDEQDASLRPILREMYDNIMRYHEEALKISMEAHEAGIVQGIAGSKMLCIAAEKK